MCVCVCERERGGGETDRQTDRHTVRQRRRYEIDRKRMHSNSGSVFVYVFEWVIERESVCGRGSISVLMCVLGRKRDKGKVVNKKCVYKRDREKSG